MLVGGYLNLVADFAHNFTDGLAIGASFGSGKGSLATTLAVLCHEVPHEVGDVAILMRSGMPLGKALRVQMLTAVGAMIGTYVGLVAGDMPVVSKYISCFIAGGFIYVATVNVIPSLFEEESTLLETLLELAAMAAGVAIMVGVALLE
jgi:zinc transporter 7